MKLLIFGFLIAVAVSVQAQKVISDSIRGTSFKELNLTAGQKFAVKKLIATYRLEERKRRRELRHKIFIILNADQQMAVRRWWRSQLRN